MGARFHDHGQRHSSLVRALLRLDRAFVLGRYESASCLGRAATPPGPLSRPGPASGPSAPPQRNGHPWCRSTTREAAAVMERLRIMASLAATGRLDAFHFLRLSHQPTPPSPRRTPKPWTGLREPARAGEHCSKNRRRPRTPARRAGNSPNGCHNRSAPYAHMVILDRRHRDGRRYAGRLAALMEARPRGNRHHPAHIVPAGARTFFARGWEFSTRRTAPCWRGATASGRLGESRTTTAQRHHPGPAGLREHCRCRLAGASRASPPLGGEFSADFVEAAFMRRRGYSSAAARAATQLRGAADQTCSTMPIAIAR